LPLTFYDNLNISDMLKQIKKHYKELQSSLFNHTNTYYKSNNTDQNNIYNYGRLQADLFIPRHTFTKIVRLRLGHTNLTHSYLFTRPPTRPSCPLCNNEIRTPQHILIECSYLDSIRSSLFTSTNPLQSIFNPTAPQIKKIIKFLSFNNIINEI